MALLIDTTATAVAHALTRIASRKVVYVRSVGDAASPVWLVAGPHSRQIGQCADSAHHVEAVAEENDALYVEGSYDGTRWVVGVPEEYAAALCSELGATTVEEERERAASRARRMQEEMARRESERPAREAAEAAYRAECEARAVEYRPLYDAARARVRVTARGRPHRADLRTLEWAHGKAIGTTDCYGAYDRQHGLAVLRRLAETGFGESVTA